MSAPAAERCPLLLCSRITGRCLRAHDCRAPAVQRAREQAKYQTDPAWAAQLIAEALREVT